MNILELLVALEKYHIDHVWRDGDSVVLLPCLCGRPMCRRAKAKTLPCKLIRAVMTLTPFQKGMLNKVPAEVKEAMCEPPNPS